MELKFKPLTHEQATKDVAGYIYINTESRISDLGQRYVNNNFWYTELCRTSKPLTLEDEIYTPCYQFLHLGGGFKATEHFKTDLIVGDNSSAIFTSQAATKVYKDAYNEGPALYEVNLAVGKNSFVEYINDSVILYKDAKFKQYNKFYIADDSTFFYSEIFSPGYSPDGTKYAYNLMLLNTELYVNDKLLIYDNLVYQPSEEDPSQFGIMDDYDRCGTCYIISNKLTDKHLEDLRRITKEEFKDIDFKIGISTFEENGIGIRILSDETYDIEKILFRINEYIRKELFGLKKLALRKQ